MSACEEASRLIQEIAERHEHVTVIVHGIMLANLRNYLLGLENIRLSFVAHSLGLAGKDALAQQRIDWEKKGFSAIQEAGSDSVAFVSKFSGELINKEYGVDSESLLPFLNGVWANDPRYTLDPKEAENLLAKFEIPKDKELLFSWGCCVPGKRFSLILEGWQKFRESDLGDRKHLALLMPATVGAAAHISELEDIASKIGREHITTIYEFSDKLPTAVLTSKRLKSVIFASEFESFMLTAAEAIHLTNSNVQHIYYDISPVAEQYVGMGNAYSFNEHTAEALCFALKKAMNSTAHGRGNAQDFVQETSNYLSLLLVSCVT